MDDVQTPENVTTGSGGGVTVEDNSLATGGNYDPNNDNPESHENDVRNPENGTTCSGGGVTVEGNSFSNYYANKSLSNYKP